MVNERINQLLRKEKINKWQVAKKIGIHESTFSKWFREQMSKEHEMQVLSAVEEIKLTRLKEQKYE